MIIIWRAKDINSSRAQHPAHFLKMHIWSLYVFSDIVGNARIEEFILCSGCAFFDRRGFGPLAPTGPNFHQGPVEGTPLHFPIPGVALERLGLPNYTFGGIGMELAPSAAVALAVPARDVYQFDAAATGREKLAQLERTRSSAMEMRRTRRQ